MIVRRLLSGVLVVGLAAPLLAAAPHANPPRSVGGTIPAPPPGATSRVFDPSSAAARGASVLGNVVRSAATTQAVIDTFVALGFLTAVAVLLLVLHKPAPLGPASHIPLVRSGTTAP